MPMRTALLRRLKSGTTVLGRVAERLHLAAEDPEVFGVFDLDQKFNVVI